MKLEELNRMHEQLAEGFITEEYFQAVVGNWDSWIPACGGTETWTTARNGRRFLYCFNPKQQKHGWLNEQDIIEEENPYSEKATFTKYV